MATRFRNMVVALARATKHPTAANIERALYWTLQEWAYGGSRASLQSLRQAEALEAARLAGQEIPTGATGGGGSGMVAQAAPINSKKARMMVALPQHSRLCGDGVGY